ncbi:MAG: hypothetical protein M3O86_05420 [Actinomycetota bacterium]|nr:hypothetical protein [Actinomycetota bacterium]
MTEGAVELPFAWFWVPLPEPIGLPDGFRYVEDADLLAAALLEGGGHSVQTSVYVHQIEEIDGGTGSLLQSLMQVAVDAINRSPDRVGSGTQYPPISDPPADVRRALTVVEMAVPWRGRAYGEPHDDDGENASEAFDRGLQTVRRLQQSYATVVQTPVRLVSLNTLPVFVPMSVGTVFIDGARLPTLGDLSVFMTNPLAIKREIRPEELTEELLEALGRMLNMPEGGSAFAGFADLRREAWVQRDYEGNTRLAALTVGMAGETLLTTLLLHMMWEEQVSPVGAAELLNAKPFLATRLNSEYHPRLGGRWSGVTGAVAAYTADVMNLRNRVAHTTHEPTREEMHASFHALTGLERYVGDLLANERNLLQYPRTAMAWMGRSGLSRRGRWTRRMQAITTDPSEPNWTVTFARWRFFVDVALSESPTHPPRSPGRLRLFVDVHRDGRVDWRLYDPETRQGAQVDRNALDLDPESLNAVDSLLAYLRGEGVDTTVRTEVAFDASKLDLSDFAWAAEYRVFEDMPLFAARRGGTDTDASRDRWRARQR